MLIAAATFANNNNAKNAGIDKGWNSVVDFLKKLCIARVLVENMDDMDADSLKSAAEYLLGSLQAPAAIFLGSCPGEGKGSLYAGPWPMEYLVVAFSTGVVDLGIQVGKRVGEIAKLCGGGGGGRPNFAQAGGRRPENLPAALEKAQMELVNTVSQRHAEYIFLGSESDGFKS